MSIDTMLREEIQDEITRLGKLELGSETYKTTVDGVTKLLDRANEMKKIDAEAQDRAEHDGQNNPGNNAPHNKTNNVIHNLLLSNFIKISL